MESIFILQASVTCTLKAMFVLHLFNTHVSIGTNILPNIHESVNIHSEATCMKGTLLFKPV